MTFIKKPKVKLVAFQSERIITKFLWLPITIKYTTRWLTRATILQQWQEAGAAGCSFYGWVNKKFIVK